MPRQRCLIVDEMHPTIHLLMEAAGIEVSYHPKWNRGEVLAHIAGYEGIIIRSKMRLDAEFFKAAAQLQWIGRAGAGIDNIDLAQAAAREVQVFNTPEGNRDAVAEHTLGLMLAVMNRIPQADMEVRNGTWQREANRGNEIMGKTVALIGYGNMGQATAVRLQSFGCHVIAYDKYIQSWPDYNATRASMEQVYAQADIVSLHLPLTYETRGWVNARFLGRFAKPIWLINTARGEIIQQVDLLYYVKTFRIKGVALDVLENEKVDQMLTGEKVVLQALAASGKVIFTPHIAGWTQESYAKINEVLVKKIAASIAELSR